MQFRSVTPPRSHEDEEQVVDDKGRLQRIRDTVSRLVRGSKFAPKRKALETQYAVWDVSNVGAASTASTQTAALPDLLQLSQATSTQLFFVSLRMNAADVDYVDTIHDTLCSVMRDYGFSAQQDPEHCNSYTSQNQAVALYVFTTSALAAELGAKNLRILVKTFDIRTVGGVYTAFTLNGQNFLIFAPIFESEEDRVGDLEATLTATFSSAPPFGIYTNEVEQMVPDRYYCIQAEAGVFVSKKTHFCVPSSHTPVSLRASTATTTSSASSAYPQQQFHTAAAFFDTIIVVGGLGFESAAGSKHFALLAESTLPLPSLRSVARSSAVHIYTRGQGGVASLLPFSRMQHNVRSSDRSVQCAVCATVCGASIPVWDLTKESASELLSTLVSIASEMEERTWNRRWFLRYLKDPLYEAAVDPHAFDAQQYSLQEAASDIPQIRNAIATGGTVWSTDNKDFQRPASRSVRFRGDD